MKLLVKLKFLKCILECSPFSSDIYVYLSSILRLLLSAEKAAISASSPNMTEEEITEETTVQLLTRLQQYQTMENNAFHALMTQNVSIIVSILLLFPRFSYDLGSPV